MTLRRKKRCSVVVAVAEAEPRLSLSMVWRRRRYSSVLPGAGSPSLSPTDESELEPFLGAAGAGGERKRGALGVLLCFSGAPPDMVGGSRPG